jgi:hypothetical protein
MKMYRFVLVAMALVLGNSVFAAAPEPKKAKVPNIWTLDVSFEHPQQIMVRIPGEPEPLRYWYMIISLTNKTGQDVTFFPNIQLTTDTLKTIPASLHARGAVFEKIRLRHQGKYPFLEALEFTDCKILQGQDNTKDLAVIFPDFDPNAKSVKIFIGGLSNETAVVTNPSVTDANGAPKTVVLAKTLELDYAIPGDKSLRDQQALQFTGKSWVMR